MTLLTSDLAARRQDCGAPARRPRPRRTVVLGMGNPILSDDAIGILLASALKPQLDDLPGVDVVEECCVGGLNLLDLLEGYDRLIALDSIKTIGGVPGTWYAFDGTALRETMNLRNVHDANFATTLALGRHMGMHLPDDTRVSRGGRRDRRQHDLLREPQPGARGRAPEDRRGREDAHPHDAGDVTRGAPGRVRVRSAAARARHGVCAVLDAQRRSRHAPVAGELMASGRRRRA